MCCPFSLRLRLGRAYSRARARGGDEAGRLAVFAEPIGFTTALY